LVGCKCDARHAGDLGNIQANAKGKVITTLKDRIVGLQAPHSVIGRAIVVSNVPIDYDNAETYNVTSSFIDFNYTILIILCRSSAFFVVK